MRPIGGEFEIAPSALVAPRGGATREPASGRGALFQILRHIQSARAVKDVALPDYVCDSVIRTVTAAGLVPRFYHVCDDLRADRRSLHTALTAPTVLLLISYFGLVDLTDDIAFARQASPSSVIVKDDVHSPFDAMNLRGADYAFTSLRKSFPLVDGAPVTPSFPMDLDETATSSFALAKIAGAFAKYARRDQPSDDRAFLALLRDGEERLDDPSALRAGMSWMSGSALLSLDRPAAAERRRGNFRALEAAIAGLGLRPIVPLSGDAVPLFLPIQLGNRDSVRAELARQNIFCPAHWPMPVGHDAALTGARHRYEGELSLVIDQRYDSADMDRLADVLAKTRAA